MTFLADAPTAIPTVRRRAGSLIPMQVLLFGAVGVLNTAMDVVVLNLLLWAFAAHTTAMVLFFNAVAYAVGAVNSFLWNKHWTFQQSGPATGGEVLRFGVATLGGMALNDILLWLAGQALLPVMGQTALATNAAKVIAIGGTVLLSYLAMRAWVFAHGGDKPRVATPASSSGQTAMRQQRLDLSSILAHHGISIVLPVYNEEQAIMATVASVVSTLDAWDADFEVIVVDDGSTDRTGAQIALLARRDTRVRSITHTANQGYGAALATGFAAATKDLTFFMDADGQFAISDLALLLGQIEAVDAVLGYRRQRQDSWLRRLNAWGWNALVALLLGVRVRDLDCAFKLFHTDFLRAHPPTTQSALINAELLYQLIHAGGTYREVGVRHLPRQSGRATGANPLVIAHALGDLLVAAWRWRRPTVAAPTSTTTLDATSARRIYGMLPPILQQLLHRRDIPIRQRGSVMLQAAQIPARWQALQARAKTTFSAEGATRFWEYLRVPHRLALLGITLISIVLNFWQLGQNGYGNLYYAAAVKSMGSNWHAFFFVSLDTAGFVTVDKPPLGFWLQVVSTKIFGFTPFAIFLPQALAGVLAVVLLYWLVRRHFGPIAGLIAALTLAVSPISVVTNRNNTIDSTLMLALLLAAWATFRAVETDRLRWLIVAGVLIGLGFNIKMLEAYLVVPALALTYLLSSNKSWARRIVNLLITGGVMAAVSLSWVLAVDIIPASLRPWVGSTQNNSELTLAVGYNGLQRLTGSSGGSGGAGGPPSGGFGAPGGGGPPSFAGNGNFTPPAFAGEGFAGRGAAPTGGAGGAGGGGQTGMFNTGNPGLFRLFTPPLGGQIVWMLPIALFAILALATQRQFRPREERRQQSLILWGTWLVTTVIFFSVASFFHQYYLSQMTPAIAALAGIGIVTMWQQYRLPGWQGWLLPLALAVTVAEQVYIISSDPTWGSWLIPLIAIPTAVAALGLALVRWRPELNITRRMQAAAVGIGLLALLIAPTIWSAYPAATNANADLPQVGVTTSGFGGGGGANNTQVDAKLISYLEANQGSATYLVATASSGTADPIILATGKAVMALGGFTGSDPTLTTSQLQTLVAKGAVRYFLLNGSGTTTSTTATAGGGTTTETGQSTAGAGGLGGAQSTATQWVQQHCTTVAASAYESTTQTTQGGFGGAQQLYDCKAATA